MLICFPLTAPEACIGQPGAQRRHLQIAPQVCLHRPQQLQQALTQKSRLGPKLAPKN